MKCRVQQRLSLPTQCELTFVDPPGTLDIADQLLPGTSLRVQIDNQSLPLFEGEVTAQEYAYGPAGQLTVHVRAYDRLHRLRKRQPVRVHVDVTPLGLAKELAADIGMTAEGASSGPVWHHLVQHDRDDLQLLSEIAADAGLYLSVRGGVLHLLSLAGDGEPIELAWRRSLLEAHVEVSSEPALRTMQVAGWNPLDVEAHLGEATGSQIGRSVQASAAPHLVGGSGQRHQVGRMLADNRHAELLAQAELDRHAAFEVTLWGVAEGDTRLRPAACIAVSGLAPTINGRYVLSGVTHTLDTRQGYVSELDTTPPTPAASTLRRTRDIATYGMVTQIDDPLHLGRVRVRLPAYADIESDWMQVLMLGAGAKKGLMIVPAMGDRVLILLPRGDAGEGIVLGGLVGMNPAADSGVEGNVVQRFSLQTPGGQRVQLDDANNILRVENSSGSFVELSPTQLRVHATQKLILEAPGRQIVIRGDAIDFERG